MAKQDSSGKFDKVWIQLLLAIIGLVGTTASAIIVIQGPLRVKKFEIHTTQTAEYMLTQRTATALAATEFSLISMKIPTFTDTPTATLTTTATATPTLTPTATFTLTPLPISFQNFEAANGSCIGPGCYFWDVFYMNCSFETGLVQEGQRSIKCDAHANQQRRTEHGGTLGVNPSTDREPVDLSAATAISVWVYDSIGGNNAELKIRYYDSNGQERMTDGVYSSSTNPTVIGAWTEISWELSKFGISDRSRIKNIEIYVYNAGIYYFDNVTYR